MNTSAPGRIPPSFSATAEFPTPPPETSQPGGPPSYGPAHSPYPPPAPQWSTGSYGPPQPGTPPATYPPQSPFPQPHKERRSRLPSAAEMLGWGGGLLTVIGVLAVTSDYWQQITGWALVGLLVAATAVLGVAAMVVGQLNDSNDDRLAANLSGALWWMAGIVGTTTTYVATNELSSGRSLLALLAASLAAAAMSGAHAYRTGRDLAVTGTIVSSCVAVYSLVSLVTTDLSVRAAVLVLAGVVALNLLSLWPDRKFRIAFGTTMVVLFGASQTAVTTTGDTLLALTVMVALIEAALVLLLQRSRGEGIVASVVAGVVVTEVLFEFAPDAFTLSTAILLIGVVMVSGCIWLAKRASRC
ncbi:MAG: hypothetical protein ACR2HR_08345 [Euzebya sp.]